MKISRKAKFILIVILLIVVGLFSMGMGIAKISIGEIFYIIGNSFGIFDVDVEISKELILLEIRLPRIISAIFIGGGLAVVGTCYQSIFRNSMADPFILGSSSGAALGVTIFLLLPISFNTLGATFFAFCGSLLATLIAYNVAEIKGKTYPYLLLLSGIAINFFVSSLISLLMILNRNTMEKIVFWTMGNNSTIVVKDFIIIIPVIIAGVGVIYYFYDEMNILYFGEDIAKTTGVDIEKVKKILFLTASIMVAVIVSYTGIIGFVGLVVPHIAKLLFGKNHRIIIPFSFIIGSIFMLCSDTIARSIIPPTEIPVGIITSVFGFPYFILILIREKKRFK